MRFELTSLPDIKNYLKETLYRNSLFLLLNNGVVAILAFVFWIVAARFYSTSQVGIVSAVECHNPDLVEVTKHVYLLKQAPGLNKPSNSVSCYPFIASHVPL